MAGRGWTRPWRRSPSPPPAIPRPVVHPSLPPCASTACAASHPLARRSNAHAREKRAHDREGHGAVRVADATTAISTTGYLVERLCLVESSAAVALTILVAARTAQQGKHEGHHVKSMVHRWPHPLRHLVRATDYADLERLVRGLSGGPERMLLNVLDLAVALRRHDPVRDDALRSLADSPYLAQATMQLRNSAVRHRRTPLTDPAWPESLSGADDWEYADGTLDR